MKIFNVLHLFFTVVSAVGCSLGKQEKDDLLCIDIRKNYPPKELILTDIANVTYLHLNTDNDDYLYINRLGSFQITENIIVISDISSGSFLFFSKDGKPKSRFNRYGRGPEEYPSKEPSFFLTKAQMKYLLDIPILFMCTLL